MAVSGNAHLAGRDTSTSSTFAGSETVIDRRHARSWKSLHLHAERPLTCGATLAEGTQQSRMLTIRVVGQHNALLKACILHLPHSCFSELLDQHVA